MDTHKIKWSPVDTSVKWWWVKFVVGLTVGVGGYFHESVWAVGVNVFEHIRWWLS